MPLAPVLRLFIALTIGGAGSLLASKRTANRPYVQSGPDGVFYARCIPNAESGSAGTTDVYQVGLERDEKKDHYDWYTAEGVTLGWSPIAGKVAVMAVRNDGETAADQQVELSFYLGGVRLRNWTTADLQRAGAAVSISSAHDGARSRPRSLGCEQVPGTNNYFFAVELTKDKLLKFDILTGELLKP